jgi:mono/diheme cytochrome c family protein
MPGFRQVSPSNRWAIVQFIKTFSERFNDSTEYPLDTLIFGKQIISSPRSLSIGRKIYLQMKCADCHGISGRGDGAASLSQVDDARHAVHTTDLTNHSDYKFSYTVHDVYRIFSTGLNGVPMPSYIDVLSDDDRWNLANYVWSLQTNDQYPSAETK